jgi:hypothetical protein
LVLNSIYLVFGTWLTHRELLHGVATDWLVSDVLVPLVITACVVGAAPWLVRSTSASPLVHLGLAIVAMVAAILVNLSLDRRAALRLMRSAGMTGVIGSKT